MPPEDDLISPGVRKTTTCQINGVRYDRLEDVPAEFRSLLERLNDVASAVPANLSGANASMNCVTKTTTIHSDVIPSGDIREQALAALLRDKSRPAKLNCSQCGYDLQGTAVGGLCPECGTPVGQTLMKLTATPSWYKYGRERSAFGRHIVAVLLMSIMAFLIAAIAYLKKCSL